MVPELRASLRARRTLVWATGLALTTVALLFVPLFDVLGFELAFVVGVLGSFAAADLGATVVRRHPHLSVAAAWATAAGVVLSILIAPLLLVTMNGLRVRVCDYGQGLIFYALLPGLSCLLGAAAGVTVQTLFRGRIGAIAAWLVVVGSLVV